MGNCFDNDRSSNANPEGKTASLKEPRSSLHQHTKSSTMTHIREASRHEKMKIKLPDGPWSSEEQDYRDALRLVAVDMLDRLAKVVAARKEVFSGFAASIAAKEKKAAEFLPNSPNAGI